MKYNPRHAVNAIKRAPLWAKIVVPSLTVAALAVGGRRRCGSLGCRDERLRLQLHRHLASCPRAITGC